MEAAGPDIGPLRDRMKTLRASVACFQFRRLIMASVKACLRSQHPSFTRSEERGGKPAPVRPAFLPITRNSYGASRAIAFRRRSEEIGHRLAIAFHGRQVIGHALAGDALVRSAIVGAVDGDVRNAGLFPG